MTAPWQDPCSPPPSADWGTFWQSDWSLTGGESTWGDWTLDGDTQYESNDIYTAVLMCLFTDRRAPDDATLPGDSDDRRGYHGDFYDVRTERGETELGSLLWLYERSYLTGEVIRNMEDAVIDCLRPLEDQGLVASSVVRVTRMDGGMVCIEITLYSQTRQKIFDARFTRVWADIYPGLAIRGG